MFSEIYVLYVNIMLKQNRIVMQLFIRKYYMYSYFILMGIMFKFCIYFCTYFIIVCYLSIIKVKAEKPTLISIN